MGNEGAYKDRVLKLYEILRIDGHKFHIKAPTMVSARSEARKKIAGSRNRKSRKWRTAKKMIVSVREVTQDEIDSMIANSIPESVYRKAGILEMLRCGLMTQDEANTKLRELEL